MRLLRIAAFLKLLLIRDLSLLEVYYKALHTECFRIIVVNISHMYVRAIRKNFS